MGKLLDKLSNRKKREHEIVLPSGRHLGISGDPEALEEFVTVMSEAINKITQGNVCEHQWVEGLVCYQIFHSEPKRYQLMCIECGSWVDVDQFTWQRYLSKELHRQNIEENEAEREAERMQDMMEPIYMLGGILQ